MKDEVNTNTEKAVDTNANTLEVNKLDNLRFVEVEIIDKLINNHISANKEVFDIYNQLITIREKNKLQVKANPSPITKDIKDAPTSESSSMTQ